MEIPYTVQARPDTGLWNAKVGIWLFLASEVMLFGGLFSAYIFLRIGADFPWPVHVLTVKWGFVNTLVLIFSSVTVLQAWLALKMRKYSTYQMWMGLTIACSLAFLCIKAVEYNDKFHHYGVRLQDGSVLEGHLPDEGYSVAFGEVKTVTLAARKNLLGLGDHNLPFYTPGSDGAFLSFLKEGKAEFKDVKLYVGDQVVADVEGGKTITITPSEVTRLLGLAVAEAKKADQKAQVEVAAKNKASGKFETAPLKEASVKMTAVSPLNFVINPHKLADYSASKATFKDGTELEGKLIDDTLRLKADKVDLRRLFDVKKDNVDKAIAAVESADAWRILGVEQKEKFVKHVAEEKEKFHKDHPKQKNPMLNADFVRETFTMELEGGAGHEAAPAKAEVGASHKAAESGESAPAHKAESGGHGGHALLPIPKKDIAFYSNFTPKYNNYFAIYFALTGLHGLHVLAGAIVLGHFLFFGKKIYQKNPEHLANRVETGGLFWHFVDLIWIFLFPLLYLM